MKRRAPEENIVPEREGRARVESAPLSPWHEGAINSAEWSLRRLCRRVLSGEATRDDRRALAAYAPTGLPENGTDTASACRLLAARYRRFWSALMRDSDADALLRRTATVWPPSLGDAYRAYASLGPSEGSAAALTDVSDPAELVQALGALARATATAFMPPQRLGPIIATSHAYAPASRCDNERVYFIAVSHGDGANEVVLMALSPRGTVTFESGYVAIRHGDPIDSLDDVRPPQRLGRRGHPSMAPPALAPYLPVLPLFLEAIGATSLREGAALFRTGGAPLPQASWLARGEEDVESESEHEGGEEEEEGHREIGGFEFLPGPYDSAAALMDIVTPHGPGQEPYERTPSPEGTSPITPMEAVAAATESRGEEEDDDLYVPLGAREVRMSLAPLVRADDLPTGVRIYLSDNDFYADFTWLGGQPVTTTWLTECQLIAALRLFVGQLQAFASHDMREARVPPLLALASRSYAASTAPAGIERAPPEALGLAAAYMWRDVCSQEPDDEGRLPGVRRLLAAAPLLGHDPAPDEMAAPELLCHALAAPALAYLERG